MSDSSITKIPNFLRLSDHIGTAGQPSVDEFATIREAGYEVVVNLRPLADTPPNEHGLVEQHGMHYISIPVVWDMPTVENVEQFFSRMQANEGKRIFVHCAKNMRVSAFMYLYRIIKQKVSPGDALTGLHRVWVPNPTWRQLIALVLQRHANAGDIVIGTALPDDLPQLLSLYQHLNPDVALLPVEDGLQSHWQAILDNDVLFYIAARVDGRLISTCTITVIPNLTRSARPYGLIENVVTHPDYRKRGIGTRVLRYALDIAWGLGCYKVMLLTGKKDEETLRFYESAGFRRGEKTGFVARPGENGKAGDSAY